MNTIGAVKCDRREMDTQSRDHGGGYTQRFAGIAQLVERNLAKVEVASSNLVSRSIFSPRYGSVTEWSCSGLQLRVRRFDSDPSLHFKVIQCNSESLKTL